MILTFLRSQAFYISDLSERHTGLSFALLCPVPVVKDQGKDHQAMALCLCSFLKPSAAGLF